MWGGDRSEFYSGLSSHHPETVNRYITVVSAFLYDFETPPIVRDLGCGDFIVGKELVITTKKEDARAAIRLAVKKELRGKVPFSELDNLPKEVIEQAEGQYRDWPMEA